MIDYLKRELFIKESFDKKFFREKIVLIKTIVNKTKNVLLKCRL